ncbi:uncharacterized protein MYCFIDRAFT_25199 [Pseudocercospora fijiensis CIRAD86]|uniref:Amidohydrolase-related domain-containing protein n=1 Tax=Pseudocercospora fijiensis (strain CIRAD86) TaxID=383855 RepID=N1QCE8_PSEFD|nr:uncharacterized protein MYCFIDRAFT_25199 [Pseudocercospora fijiensis CIRAD86]EME89098.1 hypothetical protein MYCFIDRAFT_25199 [Pseudocercospora fijiensis CIRAD86]
MRVFVLGLIGTLIYLNWTPNTEGSTQILSIERLHAEHAKCSRLQHIPQDPQSSRTKSMRHSESQQPILIRNATVWTGEPRAKSSIEDIRTGKAYTWSHADLLLEDGLIKKVGHHIVDESLPKNVKIIDAGGRQVTAGIIDMHSHTGVDSLPALDGAQDTNELSSDITPYVRSLDGLNPLDPQIRVIKSGGVTTSLILPGSGNNIGGEAFVIKHAVGQSNGRPELSIESLIADPDKTWRYMKMACGENAKNVYGKVGEHGPVSRLGEAWEFRHAFEQAAKYKNSQDEWCATADRIGAQNMQSYLPSDLRWESLSAVLRGQVLVNTHCYTIPDLESFIGYTNEFNFSVRAFHHAHSTYLIPEVLKRAYGGRAPAAALFADNMNYKTEAYVASEQAGKILFENGITPVYVSDNPVLNAQHVVFEAAKAYRAGLPYHAALAGVTSASAELLGLGNRIGKLRPNFDADVVIWDSDPLAVGATPLQVFIDGVPQFEDPVVLDKPFTAPIKHFVSQEVQDQPTAKSRIGFTGVSKILLPGHEQILAEEYSNVVVEDGRISCIGKCHEDVSSLSAADIINLQDGHIAPPLTAFGSLLGIEEITAESTTSDGSLDESSFSAAIDGLRFEGKNLAAAYRHGVTKAITAPKFAYADHKGISAGFRVGAKHALEKGAIFNPHIALHYTLTSDVKSAKTPSISSAIAELRSKLLKAITTSQKEGEIQPAEEVALSKVVNGSLPLVLGIHSADTIASILRLKSEIDTATNSTLRLAILGGAESYILANELAAADVGVILAPLFSYAATWDQRRALTGAPLTNGTAIDVLHAAGVKVAIGVDEDWEARDLFLQAGIVQINSGGKIDEKEALALASRNICEILGLEGLEEKGSDLGEFVVFDGNPLTINGQVRAVADGRGLVSVWA